MNTVQPETSFQSLLKTWRGAAGISQLRLAGLSGSSQRHISFLESGRANPSRVMVFALSEALAIPFRERNEMLLAAGFAPKYRESPLDSPRLDSVRAAIDQILSAQEPYPAVVLDRLYNVRRANPAAGRLTRFLFDVDSPDSPPPAVAQNTLRAILHPDGCRERIENWELVAAVLLRRLQAEATSPTAPPDAGALFEELSTGEHVPPDWRRRADLDWRYPMLTIDFRHGDQRFSLFSTMTTLGAPFDITLQEIRIESYFPADSAAMDFFSR